MFVTVHGHSTQPRNLRITNNLLLPCVLPLSHPASLSEGVTVLILCLLFPCRFVLFCFITYSYMLYNIQLFWLAMNFVTGSCTLLSLHPMYCCKQLWFNYFHFCLMFHCTNVSKLVYPFSCQWHLGCFTFFAILNSAAIKHFCTYLWITTCKFPWGIHLGVEFLVHRI